MIEESQFESASYGRRAMNICVNQCNEETFEMVFDETAIPISIGDMERLHYQLSKILRPTTVQEKKTRHQAFLAKLKFCYGINSCYVYNICYWIVYNPL